MIVTSSMIETVIVGRVSKAVIKRVKENMEKYCMGFTDAFEEAARTLAKPGTELHKAWYYSDYRRFIPSCINPEYLDFNKYPLKYEL